MYLNGPLALGTAHHHATLCRLGPGNVTLAQVQSMISTYHVPVSANLTQGSPTMAESIRVPLSTLGGVNAAGQHRTLIGRRPVTG